jgi:hypothetical protein
MLKTSDKGEAAKELLRLNQQIESSYTTFNILRTIPTILCLEDAVGALRIENERYTLESKPDPRRLGVIYFTLEFRQMLDTMLTEIMSRGFIDCSTKNLYVGVNLGVSIEQDYLSAIRSFIDQLQENKLIGKKYILRVQERQFLGRYSGAIFIIMNGTVDKKIVQTIDNIMQLRQLLHKKGLIETMLHLAPKGTEINFNEQSASLKYPEEFTFEEAIQKIGLSHRMIENYTHITNWNSNLPEQTLKTLKTISQGRTLTNIINLKLEQNEIFNAYNNLTDYPELFQKTYNVSLKTFFDILETFIFECYPNDNTLGVWKINELFRKKSFKSINVMTSKKLLVF